MSAADKAAKVRELNDAFRSSMDRRLGRVMMTAGVDALPSDVKAMVIRRVTTFSEFDEQNDPYHEHDFGAFSLAGRRFFFKIDALYEDPGVKGAETQLPTTCVLTIMLADEW